MSVSPRIAVTTWRRRLATAVHPAEELYTIDTFTMEALERVGALPVALPFAADPLDAERRLAGFDGLLISGGDDVDPAGYGQANTDSFDPNPAADTSDQAYLRGAFDLGLPILAVCRGIQVANVAFGGTLRQHVWGTGTDHPPRNRSGSALAERTADAEEMLARRHQVELTPGSTIAKVFDQLSIATNSLHHQAIDELGNDLAITGITGDGIVEAVEHRSHPLLGVQWHPERQQAEGHDALFRWLTEAANGDHP